MASTGGLSRLVPARHAGLRLDWADRWRAFIVAVRNGEFDLDESGRMPYAGSPRRADVRGILTTRVPLCVPGVGVAMAIITPSSRKTPRRSLPP